MLLGSGDFTTSADQARLDPHAFNQSAQIALIAMKAMPDPQARETSAPKGAAEAYIDFIDCPQEAIERQIMTGQPNLFCGS